MTEIIPTIGKILSGKGSRDAIHIATIPVQAAEYLSPAEHVGYYEDGRVGRNAKLLGIVDPYLTVRVEPGDWFNLFMYPGTITSLHHVWSHPEVDKVNKPEGHEELLEQSKNWMRDFIANNDTPPYNILMAAATGDHENYFSSSNDGEFLYFGGQDAHGEIPEEFWDHVEILSGKQIPNKKRAKYFSCSC